MAKIKLDKLTHQELLLLQGQILVEMQTRIKQLNEAIQKDNPTVTQ